MIKGRLLGKHPHIYKTQTSFGERKTDYKIIIIINGITKNVNEQSS